MRNRWILPLLSLFLILPTANAEMRLTKRFSIDAESRYRTEIVDLDFNENSGFNEYTALRTQFGASLVASRDVSLRFKIQETRFLGTNETASPSVANLAFQEAYVDVNNILGMPMDLRFGRYELSYGRERIIGSDNWNNYGPRAYDGLRLAWKKGKNFWHFAYAKVQEGTFQNDTAPFVDPSSSDNRGDSHLFLVSGSMFQGVLQPIMYSLMDERVLPPLTEANILNTVAAYTQFKWGKLDILADGGYQMGTYNDRDVASWLAAADFTFNFKGRAKFKFNLGADASSGNNMKDDPTSTDMTFYTPFATRHKFKGFMDYFQDEDQGLIDGYGGFSFQPGKRVGLEVTVHNFAYFEAAQMAGYDGFTQLGQEVDTRLRAALARGFMFEAGYLLYMPTEEYSVFKGYSADAPMSQMIYFTLTGTL